MPPKKGKKGGKAKNEGDDETKVEQKRIVREIYKMKDPAEFETK